jgi:predicted DNA-binding transcriptional regulator AlpA
MARREVTGKKPGVSTILINRAEGDELTPPPPPRIALSIPEFCAAFGISEDFFYKLKRQGQAPRLMRVGTRTLISMQAADEWRIERERAAKVQANNASSAP